MLSEKRLSLTTNGKVRYELKTPYHDGTTHVLFAPNSKQRALVTPARRGNGNKSKASDEGQDQTPTERRSSMTWAQRLKRVFTIDIETCRECGGSVKVIACIEDPVVIQKILNHLKEKGIYQDAFVTRESRPATNELI